MGPPCESEQWGSVLLNDMWWVFDFNRRRPIGAWYDRVGLVVVGSRVCMKGGRLLGPLCKTEWWGSALPNNLWRGLHFDRGGPYGGGAWWSGSGGGGWWSVPKEGAAVWCSPAKPIHMARFRLMISPGWSIFEEWDLLGWRYDARGWGLPAGLVHSEMWWWYSPDTCPLPLPFSHSFLFSQHPLSHPIHSLRPLGGLVVCHACAR